ncbi:DNA polymerase III subunit gamma/tau [Fodinicurvata sp. EGI_FJ10296]|uniref:DNA polymerase III subunit gamma/tau n=1 Tax=Fodinicurvata sp. EGI_FJ10296 TaxID=3231908 RepID=UPI003452A91E
MADTPDPPNDTPLAGAAPEDAADTMSASADGGDYRVLARKYRPGTFDQLIGQDALVRTLTNALRTGRMAHAFILTGVRGVGKTTTARIIARAINCTGPDGTGGPTPTPCGQCDACISIAADRNVDVIEIDAASNTGVDNIREIIEAVRYAPVSVRYKIYIIDEVHMLSRAAFNALLKTLEEPPDHAKFIFATTEIRKVPVTVLSRCQRFDLRRVDSSLLQRHFGRIVELEGAAIEPDALGMISRAADGSVRDGLSLLDQAIGQAGQGDAGGYDSSPENGPAVTVTADQVREMLGLADRTRIIDLFESLVTGRAADALALAADLSASGADPVVVTQDLLDFTHFLTRWKVVPDLASDPTLPEAEIRRGSALAEQLSMPALTRCWQILLKGLGEIQAAPDPTAALDMVLIRLIHGAALPTPDDLLKKLASLPQDAARSPSGPAPDGNSGPPPHQAAGNGRTVTTAASPSNQQHNAPVTSGHSASAPTAGGSAAEGSAAVGRSPRTSPHSSALPSPQSSLGVSPDTAADAFPIGDADPANRRPDPETVASGTILPGSFRELVDMIAEQGDPLIHAHLYSFVHIVRYEPRRLEFRPRAGAPDTLASQIMQLLQNLSGERWMVSVSRDEGEPTLSQQDESARKRRLEEAAENPTVKALFNSFPNAQILDIHAVRGAAVAGRRDSTPSGPGTFSPAIPGEAGHEGGDPFGDDGYPIDDDTEFYPDHGFPDYGIDEAGDEFE